MKLQDIPQPFYEASLAIKNLEKSANYLGAFIFGSVARGEQNKNSDLDIKVLTIREEFCENVNHPYINDVKLDISFNTLDQLTNFTKEEINNASRVPMIAESVIIFDKDKHLWKLKKEARKSTPKTLKQGKHQWTKFMIYHMDDKAKRNVQDDPASAMLALGININELLKYHYQLHKKWWVSNKRLLPDLRVWDPKLAKLLEKFSLSTNAKNKYKYWLKLADYVSTPMGDWRNLKEDNCNCKLCKKDLSYLI